MQFDFWIAYWAFTAFVFGAIVGSFLNVCIWRLPQGLNLSNPPSQCPECKHRLHFLPDMIPMVSQVWYGSCCRYCGKRFSWRYFWVELFSALMFLAIYLRYVPFGSPGLTETQQTVVSGCAMLFAASLITLFFIDLDTFEILDGTIILAVAAGVGKDVYLIATGARALGQHLPGIPYAVPIPVSILGGLLAFWLLWQFAALGSAALGKEAMGAGDSLLLGAMGTFLVPWPLVVTAFLIAVALGCIGGLTTNWLASRADRAQEAGAADLMSDEPAPDPGAAGHPNTELNGAVADQFAAIPLEESVPEPAAPAVSAAHSLWEAAPRETESAPSAGISSEALADDGSSDAADMEPGGDATGDAHPYSADSPGSEGDSDEAPPDAEDDEREFPPLPAESRWGRVITVAGSWVAVGTLWGAAATYPSAPTQAMGIAGVGALAAGLLLWQGITRWVRGDAPWKPQMDEHFQEDPGPMVIPFGPYLVAGTFIVMLAGRELVEWYAVSNGIALEALRSLPWEVPGRDR